MAIAKIIAQKNNLVVLDGPELGRLVNHTRLRIASVNGDGSRLRVVSGGEFAIAEVTKWQRGVTYLVGEGVECDNGN